MVNGSDKVAITNLDGLDGVETIRICVAYRLDGKVLDFPPTDSDDLARCEPVYIEMPGWLKGTEKARKFSELPPKARTYVKKISELTGAKLSIVSIGPGRAQTIQL